MQATSPRRARGTPAAFDVGHDMNEFGTFSVRLHRYNNRYTRKHPIPQGDRPRLNSRYIRIWLGQARKERQTRSKMRQDK